MREPQDGEENGDRLREYLSTYPWIRPLFLIGLVILVYLGFRVFSGGTAGTLRLLLVVAAAAAIFYIWRKFR